MNNEHLILGKQFLNDKMKNLSHIEHNLKIFMNDIVITMELR